jgi:hypothetical protein
VFPAAVPVFGRPVLVNLSIFLELNCVSWWDQQGGSDCGKYSFHVILINYILYF